MWICLCACCAESLQVFSQGVSTLCNTTIEDTLATVKNSEATRYVVCELNVLCCYILQLEPAVSFLAAVIQHQKWTERYLFWVIQHLMYATET